MLMELWVNIRGVSSHAKAPELSPPTGCQPPGPHPAPKPQRCLSSPHVSDGHPKPPELHIAARPLQKHIWGGEKSQNGDKEVAGTFPEEQGHPDTTHPQPLRPVSKKSGCAASPVPRFPHLSAPALRLGTHRARGPGMGLSWKPPALIFFFFSFPFFLFVKAGKNAGEKGSIAAGMCCSGVCLRSRAGLQGSQCPSWWYSPGGDVTRFWLPLDVPQNVSWAGQGKQQQLVPEAVAAALKP